MPWVNNVYKFPGFTQKYCGPHEFAMLICDHGGLYPDHTRLKDETIHNLCEAAYAASMKTEEGSYCRTRFVRPQHSVMKAARATMVQFGEPIAIRRASDITKAASITHDSSMALLLEEEGETPVIAGMVDYRWLTSAAVGGPRIEYEPLPGFHLEIVKPGMLKSGLFQLIDGRIRNPWNNWQIRREVWRWAEFASAHPVSQAPFGPPANNALRVIWKRMWPLLLNEIRSRGHGGAIVLVPDSSIDQGGGRPLENFHFGEKIRVFSESLYDGMRVPALQRENAELRWEKARLDLLDAIALLANLATIDGAVILTHSLRVCAAGVRLLPGSGRLAFRPYDYGENPKKPEEFRRSHGTRHNSAIDYCASRENCIAMVVSQDGDVTFVASWRDYWSLITPQLS